jgi:hypothetical protein
VFSPKRWLRSSKGYVLLAPLLLWLFAAGCGRSGSSSNENSGAQGISHISCFEGLSGYRFDGQLAFKPAAGATQAQIGSLANLLQDVRFSGSWKAPQDSDIKVTFPGADGSQDLEIRRVGGRLYQMAAGGAWQPSTGQGPIAGTIARLDPQTLCQTSLAQVDLSTKQGTRESVNGVQALHFSLGPQDLPAGSGFFGEEQNRAGAATPAAAATPRPAATPARDTRLDVWVVPSTHYPVKMQLNASEGGSNGGMFGITVNVTDLGGSDISIPVPSQ